MHKFLSLMLFTFLIANEGQAQLGRSGIGQRDIGKDSMTRFEIAGAATPECLFPGSCAGGFPVYIFTGAGNWDLPGNWNDLVLPPAILPAGYEIVIAPADSSECLLNTISQTISPGAKLTILPGKKLRIPGKLINN